MLVLSYDDVSRLPPMDECIDVLEEAVAALARGQMYLPLRFVVRPPVAAGFMGSCPRSPHDRAELARFFEPR